MRVNVLVLDDVFDLGLSAVLDAFQTANELNGSPQFDVRIVGVRNSVTSAQGFRIPVQKNRSCDCVVVPAIGFKMPDPLENALKRKDVRDAADLLRQWSRRR